MKTRRSSLVTGLLVAVILAVSNPQPARALSTNFTFDADTVGLLPPEFTSGVQPTAGSTVMVTSVQSASSPNSLELLDMGDYRKGAGYAWRIGMSSYLPYFSNDLFSFDVRFSTNVGNQFRFQLWNSGQSTLGTYMNVLFNNGSILAQYGTNALIQTNLGISYAADFWYNVRVQLTPADNAYNLAIVSNGAILAQLTNLYYKPDAPDGVIFINDGWIPDGQTGPTSVFIDNVFFGPIPEPSVAAILVMGALAAGIFVRRARR